jgi:tetratricopeptide (TPR) repeat protein
VGVALRLIDTSQGAVPAVPSLAPDAELLARARAALARADYDTYLQAAADTAGVEDPQRRYVARRSLVEAGLEPRPQETQGGTATRLLAAAGAALDVLSPEPAEPFLLNLAGVALYELDASRGAEALFRAAHRLDPSLEHVERNLKSLKKRRKAGVRVQLPQPVAAAVPALDRRAKAIAGAARPGEPQTISLCMIVRDEEAVLGRCLASVAGAVDEIVVVDTGSTDRTVEIAREHGAKVLEHVWTDHFAEARNVGLEAATGDWILHLDADEAVAEGEAARLRELTRRGWREGFLLTLVNKLGAEDGDTVMVNEALRLFRNRPHHRFEGRVHETVLHRLPADAPERIEVAGVRLDHDGYLHSARAAKDKTRRNLELLERQLREEQPSAYLHFNLGTEYAALGDLATAAEHFDRAWRLLTADRDPAAQPFGPALASRNAATLRALGRTEAAARAAEAGLGLFPDFTDLVFEQAAAARAEGDLKAAEDLLRRCLDLGDAPARYVRLVGSGSFLAASELGAVLVARGKGDEAEKLLHDTLTAHPRHDGAIEPLALAMLGRGASPQEVVEAVRAAAGEPTADMRFALAATFHGAGLAADAEAELRAALAVAPELDAARVALAEALLSQRRFAEAATEAAAVAETSPWAAKAAVSQAFAALVANETQIAADALDRAERAGTPDHERAVLGAWAQVAAGGDERVGPASLPTAGLGLLVTALEALLRVEEFDAFAALLPLTERVDGLAARDRRELLGGVYLRRGFLDSAAEEWALACEEGGPDARALAGLAQVAAARGEAGDAQVFAEAALELDPTTVSAHRVLAAVAT